MPEQLDWIRVEKKWLKPLEEEDKPKERKRITDEEEETEIVVR